MISFDQLATCLDAVDCVAITDDRSTWRAGTLGLAGGHIFGGQMIGQAITIAARLQPGHDVKSIHVAFPRGTRDTGTLDFQATTMHAGSTYGATRVEVSRPERARPDRGGVDAVGFTAHVLHHRPGTGVEHQVDMPDVGAPDRARRVDLGLVPWDTRIVGGTDLDARRQQPNELMWWSRVDADTSDAFATHQALLAFASELTLIGTALLPHERLSQLDAHVALRTSVLTHSIRFHRRFRADEWLLIAQSSPVATGGSAFGTGHVFTEAGELVASFEQESMIRTEEAT